jgi:alpha-mannosidase
MKGGWVDLQVNGYAGVDFNSPGLCVETVKPAEDGKGIVVRLYNPQNCSFETVVKTAPVLGFASCKKVDLLENTVEELALEPKLQVGPYEIVSLRFE